jgi:multicomponent Na+:H+ antiporter subunit D
MACITMFVGALGAVAQTDIKRLLAYSSVSQIGYILMGVGFFTVGGMSAALFYIISHGVIKSSLFLAAGILKKMRGSTDMADHGDMLNISPAFTIIFFIGVISLGGIPPSGGFFMKFQLIKAGLDGAFYIPVIVAFVVSMITLFYLFRTWQKVCLSAPPPGGPLVAPSVKLLVPVAVLAMLCLVLGLAASPVSTLTEAAAQQLFSPELYIRAVMGAM